ncbi:MAG: hypothetical protein K0R50_2494 [Eubacterium sp.]|jgi:two-component system sensor histidine kinase YesM|nr:hypothetical protein [Eubacterium sp.]
MRAKKLLLSLIGFFSSLRLAHKLMIIYSAILGITIIIFASQLINVANNSTELDLINDSMELLKETKYSIEREIDTCYRTINAISSDYDTMSYIKSWDKNDQSGIFDFNLDLTKKVLLIRNLSPDVYQFRIYVSNPNFPEIGSFIYSGSRLENKNEILDEYAKSPNGFWKFDHPEVSYNPGTIERKNVVSLFVPLKYSNYKELGIIETTMYTDTFFRHMFSQSEKQNLIAFVVDNRGNIIYDKKSAFTQKYNLDKTGLKELFKGYDLKENNKLIHINKNKISMNLIYDYIENLDCTICYVVTNESITSNIRNSRNLIIAESLLAMLFLCVLIYIFTNILLVKMKQIIASMRKVEAGKLDVRVNVDGQDEMSELAFHFNRMLSKIEDLISEVVKKQEAKKNAEIHALFTQINSHFIINTLQNISMMAEIDCNYTVADAINSLGKLLRYSMKWTKEFVRLKEELDYIGNYIILMNIRYDYEIKLNIQVSQELMDVEILKMMLQPAVENAIYYGIEPLGSNGEITIKGYMTEEYSIIEIIDNGNGMDSESLGKVQQALLSGVTADGKLEKKGNGIGLRNVNERIKLCYGNNYGIEITSEKGSFTKLSVKLPPNSIN